MKMILPASTWSISRTYHTNLQANIHHIGTPLQMYRKGSFPTDVYIYSETVVVLYSIYTNLLMCLKASHKGTFTFILRFVILFLPGDFKGPRLSFKVVSLTDQSRR